ncbi:MAG: hypothetical protein ACYTFO_02445 [Planctomycetota bacterium]|jgi:hypothetical protein
MLSADAALAAEVAQAVEAGGRPCAVVATGYEAAAEVLVDPPGDVIVDASMMARDDRALIELARRAGASVWRMGLCLAGTDLTGVHPIEPGQLGEALSLTEAPDELLDELPDEPEETMRLDRPGDLWTPSGRPTVARPPSVAEVIDEGFMETAEAFLAEADRTPPPAPEDLS